MRWIQDLPLDIGSRPWFLLFRVSHSVLPSAHALNFFNLALAGFSNASKVREALWGACSRFAESSKHPFMPAGTSSEWDRLLPDLGAAEAASRISDHPSTPRPCNRHGLFLHWQAPSRC
jgi:hypothetical protein